MTAIFLRWNVKKERGYDMKAEIDKSGCISCGLCADTCPNVFRMTDDGPAEVYVDTVPAGDEQLATDAQESCPVSVITVTE